MTMRTEPLHPSGIDIRPLTGKEIEQLERALVKPIDRSFLVFWVLQSIRDVVKLSTQPTLRDYRDDFLRIARDGRQWLQQSEECPGQSLLRQSTELDQLTIMVSRFCDSVETVAKRLDTAIKPGHPRIPIVLEGFLDRMIGIAKKARVLPSTPSRAPRSQTAPRLPPAFFNFTIKALAIARSVIKSSPLPEDQKNAALASLRVQSNEALSKNLERLRGRISNYREGEHGLIEW